MEERTLSWRFSDWTAKKQSLSSNTPTPDLLALCSHSIAFQRYAAAFTGEIDPARAARAMADETGPPVVVTAGRDGAHAFALLQDWDLPRRLRFSAAVAALKCRGLGGRSAIPGSEEAMAFCEEGGC